MYSVCSVGHAWTEQPIFFVDFEGSRASGILEFGVVEILRGSVMFTPYFTPEFLFNALSKFNLFVTDTRQTKCKVSGSLVLGEGIQI